MSMRTGCPLCKHPWPMHSDFCYKFQLQLEEETKNEEVKPSPNLGKHQPINVVKTVVLEGVDDE